MRSEKRIKILESLKAGAETAEDLLFVFTLPYGTTLPKIWNLREKRQREREMEYWKKQQKKKINEEKRRFSNLMCKLKREGLVENQKGKVALTKKGERYLRNKNFFRIKKYSPSPSNSVNLVIFDIPEKERKKRYWIRETLRGLDYRYLQKSVWVGKNKIPEDFLHDLAKMNLHDHVEIFSISRKGTLTRREIR